jgi:CRISPR/Cas system-associated exonuclease Cas4 (RecB family)
MGFIDAIYNDNGKTIIMDYKTSKSSEITNEYRLQLAIYSLLYLEEHKVMPHRAGIYFLKDKEIFIDVDKHLIDHARFEVEQIHLLTQTEHIKEFPKKPGPLCKWKTGHCDFYEICFC